jgi:hypothetical protein
MERGKNDLSVEVRTDQVATREGGVFSWSKVSLACSDGHFVGDLRDRRSYAVRGKRRALDELMSCRIPDLFLRSSPFLPSPCQAPSLQMRQTILVAAERLQTSPFSHSSELGSLGIAKPMPVPIIFLN